MVIVRRSIRGKRGRTDFSRLNEKRLDLLNIPGPRDRLRTRHHRRAGNGVMPGSDLVSTPEKSGSTPYSYHIRTIKRRRGGARRCPRRAPAFASAARLHRRPAVRSSRARDGIPCTRSRWPVPAGGRRRAAAAEIGVEALFRFRLSYLSAAGSGALAPSKAKCGRHDAPGSRGAAKRPSRHMAQPRRVSM